MTQECCGLRPQQKCVRFRWRNSVVFKEMVTKGIHFYSIMIAVVRLRSQQGTNFDTWRNIKYATVRKIVEALFVTDGNWSWYPKANVDRNAFSKNRLVGWVGSLFSQNKIGWTHLHVCQSHIMQFLSLKLFFNWSVFPWGRNVYQGVMLANH